MKTAFVAVTAAVTRCRKYVENQVVDHLDAPAAWEWRMLNSLATLAWLKTFLRNVLAAGPRAPIADRAVVLGTRFFCISASLRGFSV